MDKIKIQAFINNANNVLQDYQRHVNMHGVTPQNHEVASKLEDAIKMISHLQDKIYELEAWAHAERAVKERFKELYVESVVDKALKEELGQRGNPRARTERDFHRAPFPPPNKE